MGKFQVLIVLSFVIALVSCKKNTTSDEPVLLFKSGFEGGVYIDNTAYQDNEDYRYISGTDSETGFSWPINILGASNSGMHFVLDENHQAVTCEIQKTIGHDGDSTNVLYMQENYAAGDTQLPYEILDITEGRKDLTIKYWMKIDAESLSQHDTWRAIFEYKTKGYASGTGFRLIAYIYTDVQGNPYWHFQGDRNPEHPLWEVDNYDVPIPQEEWFNTEFYWHFGNKKHGVASWKINGQTIAEVQDQTTRNNKPIDFIMLTQIYGDGNPKHQWVDDIEIWEGVPSE